MHTLDAPVFDADNHYYEALDAFTRYLDPALGPRVIEWVEMPREGVECLVVVVVGVEDRRVERVHGHPSWGRPGVAQHPDCISWK